MNSSWRTKVVLLVAAVAGVCSISLPASAQLNPHPSIFNEPPYNQAYRPRPRHRLKRKHGYRLGQVPPAPAPPPGGPPPARGPRPKPRFAPPPPSGPPPVNGASSNWGPGNRPVPPGGPPPAKAPAPPPGGPPPVPPS